MFLTVRDALDQLLKDAGELGDAQARSIGLSLLNDAIYDIWMAHAWLDYQSPSPLAISLAAARSRYALPNHVGRLLDPVQLRTAPYAMLQPIARDLAGEAYKGMGTSDAPTGLPKHYGVTGIVGVLTQPASTGEAIEVVSSSASDTNVQVTVRGDDTDGVQRTVRVTLGGTSPVALGTFTWLDEFGKATVNTATPTAGQSSVGTITLRTVTDQTTLQSLDKYESAREHKILQIYPVPDAAYTLAVPFMRRPQPLVADSDPIPGDWWKAV
ncbi:MAG TPA: hypothetical protein VGK49_12230, partial [Ilumatobacteraceae bacterium]